MKALPTKPANANNCTSFPDEVLADFSPSGFRIMDVMHEAEGKQHPHPPSQSPHWRAELRNRGFEVRRFVKHHQEVLIAKHSIPSPGSLFTANPDEP